MKRTLLIAALALAACHKKPTDDGQSGKQRQQSAQTDQAAKKGALTEQLSPEKDLAAQERNLERLAIDEKGSRASGNHAAVWAIHWDQRRTRKLVAKDRQLVAEGTTEKKDVADPAAAKAEQKGRAQ